MAIIIKSVKGYKFPLKSGQSNGYCYSTGLALYDNVSNEWISSNGSEHSPYVPLGCIKFLKIILENPGEFLNLSPRCKSI